MDTSAEWEEQLVQLNHIYACLASANKLERTGVSLGDAKRSRPLDRVDDSLGEHLGVNTIVYSDVLHNIFANVPNLVCLIEAENEFVRHSVKKILIAISDHLILKAQEPSWCSLLHHIWKTLLLGCAKGLIIRGDRITEKHELTSHSSNLLAVHEINHSLHFKEHWGRLVCGLEVLRCILKACLKENVTVFEHTEIFLGLLEEKFCALVKLICPLTCNQGDFVCSKQGLACGALLQLLCTAIACCDWETEDATSRSTELQSSLIDKIGGCIPLFAEVALSPRRHPPSAQCPSSFLRHKVLRLMIGLSRWFKIKLKLPLLCLRALRKEASDLTGFSLLEDCKLPRDNNLAHSSFVKSFLHIPEKVGESLPLSATHLRCRALFLLFQIWSLSVDEPDPYQSALRNSLNLKNPEDRKELEDRAPHVSAGVYDRELNYLHQWDCSGASTIDRGSTVNFVNLDIISNSSQCEFFFRRALKEEASAGIQEWLNLQSDSVPIDKIEEFSMVFVGLYLDEDDLMIEMLLLLVGLRSSLLALVERNMKRILPIATALGPAQLLHAFLQTLSYDHTVLVDYLISESTGALFLQYLMQCTGFFIKPEFYDQMEHSSLRGTSKTGSLDLVKRTLHCLSQLKAAIERLYRRKLFPYNPSPLLRRLEALEKVHQRM